jgi:hypothetical protein
MWMIGCSRGQWRGVAQTPSAIRAQGTVGIGTEGMLIKRAACVYIAHSSPSRLQAADVQHRTARAWHALLRADGSTARCGAPVCRVGWIKIGQALWLTLFAVAPSRWRWPGWTSLSTTTTDANPPRRMTARAGDAMLAAEASKPCCPLAVTRQAEQARAGHRDSLVDGGVIQGHIAGPA